MTLPPLRIMQTPPRQGDLFGMPANPSANAQATKSNRLAPPPRKQPIESFPQSIPSSLGTKPKSGLGSMRKAGVTADDEESGKPFVRIDDYEDSTPIEPVAPTSQTNATPGASSGLAGLRSNAQTQDDHNDRPTSTVNAAQSGGAEEETIKVRILQVLRRFPDGFSMMLVHGKRKEKFVITTRFPSNAEANDQIEAKGVWETYKGNEVFRASMVITIVPKSASGVVAWIRNGAVPGVGIATAMKLSKHFGAELRDVIDKPERLLEAKIDFDKANDIAEAWKTNAMQPELIVFLGELGLGASTITKIINTYGNTAKAQIQTNPWQLADRIERIGFKSADEIALRWGHAPDSPARIRSALRASVKEAIQRDGHCGLPIPEMVAKAVMMTGLPRALIESHVENALDGVIAIHDEITGYAYPAYLLEDEKAVAKHISRLLSTNMISEARAIEGIAAAERELRIKLDPSQREAAIMALTNAVCVITGGPGTGKSTTQKVIVSALKKFNRDVVLGAPTGRAAKRLTEVTGGAASTCHRLLQSQEGQFVFCAENQLEEDWFIIDEYSMVDIRMANSFTQAIRSGSGLTIVGDVDQLPSVGPGQVLRDLITSGVVPTATLSVVHRQGNDSGIVPAAHRINNGEYPLPDGVNSVKGFKIEPLESAESIAARVVRLISELLPAKGLDPMRDVQVLTAMRGRDCGVDMLNLAIKNALNPVKDDGNSLQLGARTYTVGDRVMHIRNDYGKSVYNGEIGTVCYVGEIISEETEKKESFIKVSYSGFEASYGKRDIEDIEMAYATTVHKSQGCEFPVVIFVCHRSQNFMLKRNLLYTAVTRAKALCLLIGPEECVLTAARTADSSKRYTGLSQRLRIAMAPEPDNAMLEQVERYYAPAPGGFIQIDEP